MKRAGTKRGKAANKGDEKKKKISMRRAALLISYSLKRWYGFEDLTKEQRAKLFKDFEGVGRRLTLLQINRRYGAGTSEKLFALANAVEKVAELGKDTRPAREGDEAGPLALNIVTAFVEVSGVRISLQDWLSAASSAQQQLLDLANDMKAPPFPNSYDLDPKTILIGERLRSLYEQTYPGKPFEASSRRTSTTREGEIPNDWGPGPLFVAIAMRAISEGETVSGASIKKAAVRIKKHRGDT